MPARATGCPARMRARTSERVRRRVSWAVRPSDGLADSSARSTNTVRRAIRDWGDVFTAEIAKRAENEVNELTEQSIVAAIEVHRALGPGLLESRLPSALRESVRRCSRQMTSPVVTSRNSMLTP